MKESWERRIQRAEQLAAKSEATKELLVFYGQLLRVQQGIYEDMRSRRGWLPSGILEEDLLVIRPKITDLLEMVGASGPTALAAEAQMILQADDALLLDTMLLEQWRAPSDTQFFAKAFLQPYARWLADSGAQPVDRDMESKEGRCPFCGGLPQVSYLHTTEAGSESGGRHLICSTCLTEWPFRRVICVHCGEERPARLGYFHSPEYDHIRVEACDTCQHYIKGVDLTRLGLAVPSVDEVAAAPLDLWAHEHGYTKLELNLVGL